MLAPVTELGRVELAEHTWELRGVEFEDASRVTCFECVACGAVRFE